MLIFIIYFIGSFTFFIVAVRRLKIIHVAYIILLLDSPDIGSSTSSGACFLLPALTQLIFLTHSLALLPLTHCAVATLACLFLKTPKTFLPWGGLFFSQGVGLEHLVSTYLHDFLISFKSAQMSPF